MRAPIDATAYAGRRGFENLSTTRLSDVLGRYKKLRDEARDDGTRLYAVACVREIRAEFDRRRGEATAVAA